MRRRRNGDDWGVEGFGERCFMAGSREFIDEYL